MNASPHDLPAVSASLQAAYDEQYGAGMTAWRELGAKAKARNILQLCKGRNFQTVLECGAGEGSVLQRLDDSGSFDQLSALEISDSGIAQIRNRTFKNLDQVVKFDGYHIPFEDQTFDLVYCTHVLEHVEHPRLLLRELRRVARYQIFEVPLDYDVGCHTKAEALLAYGHINVYTPSLFKFLLITEGFRILKDRLTQPSDDLLRYIWHVHEKRPCTWTSKWSLKVRPLRERWRRLRMGKHRYREFAHTALTCLCEPSDDGAVFKESSSNTATTAS